MAKLRVYELAKELKVSSKDLMELLPEFGVKVKNHMSTLEDDLVEQVRDSLGVSEVSDLPEVVTELEIEEEKGRRRLEKRPRPKGKGKEGRAERPPRADRPKERAPKKEPEPGEAKEIELPERLTVQELAARLGRPGSQVVKLLFAQGIMAGLNQTIEFDVAAQVAGSMGFTVKRAPEPEPETPPAEEEDRPEDLRERPPVVTVMGHVDHGKTSLLDAIRNTRVTAQEAGGITQHIGASVVEHNGRKIVFLDTPGHEAFTAMRARGAQVTDIAVLVVAADDGVMPQTVEAINHAKAAGVPIIVAINKIDKPGARPDLVKQQLTEYGLVAEEWGGDTICLPVSAVRKEGIEDLLEMILLVADMQELKANPNRPAVGTIIEAQLDRGRGPVATVLVQKGTLRVGDAVVAGTAAGRVRAMINDKGQRVSTAGPSEPVSVLGFSEVPQAGDLLKVVRDEKTARALADQAKERLREKELKLSPRLTLDELYQRIQEGKVKELNLVVKADVQGSVEAVSQALEKLSNPEVKVKVIHGGVGAITETDVMLAAASSAIIIGFNVRPEGKAAQAAEEEKVDVRLYRVIYDAIDDVKAAMQGLLAPKLREVSLGRAEVRAIFHVPKAGTVAGCYVQEGKFTRDAAVRLIRDGVVIYEGKVASLRRFKDDVREVAAGYECGITLANFQDIKEGDVLEAFRMEEVPVA
ncbi:MAG: translation initiation factor [Bacillota bacterium]|jgi:translation initiation factor IF-2|nr:translation initiation factor [Bacillota bacterium]MDK2855534.1 translation initiation factor [Bacillota bacterium]MDK2925473.1 translation initiation factor [Bacillota bacterium]